LDLCQRGWTYGPISLAEIGFLAHVTPTTAGRQLCKLNELGVLVYEPGCRRRQGIVRLVSKETLERMLAERIADGPDLRARVFGRKLGSPCASFRPENPTAARELPAGKHDPSARVLERQTRALRASSRAPNPRAARELPAGKHDPSARVLKRQTRALRATQLEERKKPPPEELAATNGAGASHASLVVAETLETALAEHWSGLAPNGQSEVIKCVEAAAKDAADYDGAVQHLATRLAAGLASASNPPGALIARARTLSAADLATANAAAPASAPRLRDVFEVIPKGKASDFTKDPKAEVHKILAELRGSPPDTGGPLPTNGADRAQPIGSDSAEAGRSEPRASSALPIPHRTEELPTMTKQQRRALEILTSWPQTMDVPTLAHQLGTSPQGAARTASSLVGQGLAYRVHIDGKVHYASKLR
jgi:hypothetical protein